MSKTFRHVEMSKTVRHGSYVLRVSDVLYAYIRGRSVFIALRNSDMHLEAVFDTPDEAIDHADWLGVYLQED